jgi:hypothetical protein
MYVSDNDDERKRQNQSDAGNLTSSGTSLYSQRFNTSAVMLLLAEPLIVIITHPF